MRIPDLIKTLVMWSCSNLVNCYIRPGAVSATTHSCVCIAATGGFCYEVGRVPRASE